MFLITLRLATALAIALAIGVLGSFALAGVVGALWIIADIGIPKAARIPGGVVGACWIALFCFVAIPSGFLGYRIAHGVVYRAHGPLSVRGIEIEHTGGANGGIDHQLLPGLKYSYYEGPYGVQIFLHDPTRTAIRARITDAVVVGESGQTIRLDMRDEVRWFESAPVSEDGWIPFQTHWINSGGHETKVHPIRCGLMSTETADLQSLGSELTLSFTLHLDIDGEVTTHDVTMALTRKHVSSSGITVHS